MPVAGVAAVADQLEVAELVRAAVADRDPMMYLVQPLEYLEEKGLSYSTWVFGILGLTRGARRDEVARRPARSGRITSGSLRRRGRDGFY